MLLLTFLAAVVTALPAPVPAAFEANTAVQISATMSDGSIAVLGNLLPLKGAPINSTCIPVPDNSWVSLSASTTSVSQILSLPSCSHVRVYAYRKPCPDTDGEAPFGNPIQLGEDAVFSLPAFSRGTDVFQDVASVAFDCLDSLFVDATLVIPDPLPDVIV